MHCAHLEIGVFFMSILFNIVFYSHIHNNISRSNRFLFINFFKFNICYLLSSSQKAKDTGVVVAVLRKKNIALLHAWD